MEDLERTTGAEPYAVLEREHRLIERVLDALGRICDETRRTGQLDARAATLTIGFLRDFADRTHHLKEEKILLPAIDARTFFPGCGLLDEHEQGRDRVRSMAEAALRASQGDEKAVLLFVRKARSLISLLRAHIAKEDDCLASVVRSTFSRDEREGLARQFDEAERQVMGERVFERFAAVAEEIEASVPPPREADSASPSWV